MTVDIELQNRSEVHYVGFSMSARLSEFGDPGGPNESIPRVYAWLADNEIEPLGGPLYVYRDFGAPSPDPSVDLTVTVPVGQAIEPSSGLVSGSLPGGPYVVCRYRGHPDGFSALQPEVRAWAESNNLHLGVSQLQGDLPWTGYAEHYLTDPEDNPDPATWVTDLLFATA